MRFGLMLVAVAAAAVLVVPGSADATTAHAAATCSDFSNQAGAQRAADTRDPDGDGVYCESLPCPCLKPGEGGGSDPKPKPRKKAKVISARITKVTDGDTVRVRTAGGKRRRVRLIGIDTPETHKPGTAVECGGREATDSMVRIGFAHGTDTDGDGLLDKGKGKGRKVTLRTDPSQATYDRYHRLLAYARVKGGRSLAESQLRRGWAKVYVYNHNPFKLTKRFRRIAKKAKQNARGVWGACGGHFHVPSPAVARASRAKPRTRITAMKMKLRGHDPGEDYYVVVALRLRVCGRPDRVVFRITETSSPFGRNRPVHARTRRTIHQDQAGKCDTHRISFELAEKFFGISRYRVAVRAKTTGRRFSRVRARHVDTED